MKPRMEKDFVVIVAGGKGLRMGADVPKQFMAVGGKPILMRTIERFRQYSDNIGIIVVLPHGQHDYWRKLCSEYGFGVPCTVVDGGSTRFHSSQNGLNAIPEDANGVVGIHDGVRPFVPIDVIKRCYDAARKCGAAIPVMPVVDTLRLVAGGRKAHNVLRSDYRVVQTPQAFRIDVARKAFDCGYDEAFTDDASVVEKQGQQVEMVEGSRENIKLTTQFDLCVAEAILKNND